VIIGDDKRDFIKTKAVELVATVPPILQLPLGDTIGIIADSDFYKDWLNLVPDIVSLFNANDLVTTNAMLQIAHSVFKRWRPKFRSDELFLEIKYVLEIFCQPYLVLFQQVDELITTNQSNQTQLRLLFDTLLLLLKLYVDLNCQDIPEFFEDNLTPFMTIFHKYLTYNNRLLVTDVYPFS
jgi:exportin-2 (importin alpha re-exporter)